MAADGLTPLVLLGAAGTARDVLSIIADINRQRERYRVEALLDDNPQLWKKDLDGVRIAGPLSEAGSFAGASLVNTLGSPRNYAVRRLVGERLRAGGRRFESIVHPASVISARSRIGAGGIVYPQVVIMANVTLGEQVLLLANTVLNHDAAIGDYSIAASGVNLSGAVRVGASCYLGVASAVMHGVSIGDGALVGMGSVVRKDVAAATVVAGNPARVLRRAQ